jgi:hypothetical protein
LLDGEPVRAMAMKQENDGMIFLLVNCLKTKYQMNRTNTNEGGYDQSDLRWKLNTDILGRFPENIWKAFVPFENGDFLRLLTEKEIFGDNPFGEREPRGVKQFELMKDHRNRIAFLGEDGDWEYCWLQNKVDSAYFALVGAYGLAACSVASNSFGVRPAFKILNQRPLVGRTEEE